MIRDALLDGYRAGLVTGQLRLPRCGGCGRLIAPPRPRCPWCMSREHQSELLSGHGSVYTFTVIRRAQGEFSGTEPFAIGYVEFDEGTRMLARIEAVDVDAVTIAAPVAVIPAEVLTVRLIEEEEGVHAHALQQG